MSWILKNIGLVSEMCFDLTDAGALWSAQTAVSDHTASRSFKTWGEDTKRSEKEALFMVGFFSLSLWKGKKWPSFVTNLYAE